MSEQNPVRELCSLGQSPWIDQIRREWLTDGTLLDMVERDGIRGVTSNPSIFEAALRDSGAYDAQIAQLVAQGADADAVYDRLTIDDIRAACDVFLPLYAETDGADGYVSHEVSPRLAHDAEATVDEAHRLWKLIDRPNVMIKIPATNAGLPAISRCIVAGININVTLMFSMAHYDAVAEAYLCALEERAVMRLPLEGVASVASFFVSRVETWVDRRLDAIVAEGALAAGAMTEPRSVSGSALESRIPIARGVEVAARLRGMAAVANARRVWRRSEKVFGSTRFQRLERIGARRQRVLWASTSSKDPAYRDVKYVEELIGPNTVNTLPLATMEAFRDHGVARRTVDSDLDRADAAVRELCELGIDLEVAGEELQRDGVTAFEASFEAVLEGVAAKIDGVVSAS